MFTQNRLYVTETIRSRNIDTGFFRFFPQEKIIPKLHFLEHYPQLIWTYPLVFLWSMRFEAKHSNFKCLIQHTHCFGNILLSMAVKHQVMIAYGQYDPSVRRPVLQATKLWTVDVTLLREDQKCYKDSQDQKCYKSNSQARCIYN